MENNIQSQQKDIATTRSRKLNCARIKIRVKVRVCKKTF